MKKETYQINIDQPCHEDWSKMSSVEQGRFCNSCCKCVIDFTQLSDKEILQFLTKNKGEACGRFTNDQLDRPLLNPNTNRKPHYSFLLAGLLLIGIADFSFAKPPLKPTTEFSVQSNEDSLVEDKEEEYVTKDSTRTIEGTITKSVTNEKMDGIRISVKGSKLSTLSDKNGHYKLQVPENLVSEKITLIVDGVGYENQEIVVEKKNLPITKNICLSPSNRIVMGIIALPTSKKKN